MKIALFVSTTFPNGTAATNKVRHYAKALLEAGHDVTVISFGNSSYFAGQKKILFHGVSSEGIPFVNLYNRDRPKSFFGSIIYSQLLPFCLFFYALLRANDYDVGWIYITALVPQLLFVPLIRLRRRKLIWEAVEYPYAPEGDKFTEIPVIKNLFKWAFMHLVIPLYDGFDVISENLEKEIRKTARLESSYMRTPILIDANEWKNVEARKPDGVQGWYIMHAGALSNQKDGIVNYFKVFAEIRKELMKYGVDLKLVITKYRPLAGTKEKIEKIIDENNLREAITVTGFLSLNDLQSFIKGAIILIYNKPYVEQNLYNFPIKMGDYLLSGVPVVVGAKGIELNKYLKHEENALVCEPDDIEGLKRQALRLLRNTELRTKIGQNGRMLAEHAFDYRSYVSKLDHFFNAVKGQ